MMIHNLAFELHCQHRIAEPIFVHKLSVYLRYNIVSLVIPVNQSIEKNLLEVSPTAVIKYIYSTT